MSHDIYAEFLRPGATERAKVLAGRLAVIAFSIIPVVLALRRFDLVNFIVIYAAKLMVSLFFVPVVIGLHWKRATGAGALASMVGGAATCIGWSLVRRPAPLGLDPAEVGVAASLLLFVLVSQVTAPVAAQRLGRFFPG